MFYRKKVRKFSFIIVGLSSEELHLGENDYKRLLYLPVIE